MKHHIAGLQNLAANNIPPPRPARVVWGWLLLLNASAVSQIGKFEPVREFSRQPTNGVALSPVVPIGCIHVPLLDWLVRPNIPPSIAARVVWVWLWLLLDASSVSQARKRGLASTSRFLPLNRAIKHHIAGLQNLAANNIPPPRPARVVCLLCLFVAHRFPLQITTA
jgi:hypothetical protein